MKRKLVIIGAGGHGKVAADIAVRMNRWDRIIFLDDNRERKECMGFPVAGNAREAHRYQSQAEFFVAIGNNTVREKIQEGLEAEGVEIVTLLHPYAVIGMLVEIGRGSIVMAGAVINSGSHIGKGCIINTGSSIDHDNEIGDYVHISPGAHLCGTVKVGKKSWIGAGSIVSNDISVCAECQTGAGAVVVKDIKRVGIYVGVPAQFLKK